MLESATLFDDADDGRWATISPDGLYRYDLGRRWDEGPLLGWVMLNPSVADANVDDQTIRQCCYFARREGYAGIYVVNLYAYRATHPTDLWAVVDPVGPNNDHQIAYAATSQQVGAFVVAWGNVPKRARGRVRRVMQLLRDDPREVLCCGRTRSGAPRHPSRLSHHTELVPYD